MNSKSNTPLIVIVSVLATLTVVMAFLLITNIYKPAVIPENQTSSTISEETSSDEITDDTETPATTRDNPTIMYVANVKNSIYLRSQPEENQENIITTIPVGTQIIWFSDVTPVFSKISYNGTTGYVKRDYLSLTKPAPAQPSNTTVSKYMYVANVKNSIYLRSTAAETSNNIITTIPLGTRVGFIEYANNTFSKINYNGTIGYAKSIYLSDYSTGYTYMTVCNVKTSIYLRSAPVEDPNNILCEIPVNSTVRYISSAGNGFYKISWNGYTGYSKSQYLR